MIQRIITGIIFTLAILAFVVPGYFFKFSLIALTVLVAVMAAYEVSNALREKDLRHVRLLLFIGSAFSVIPVALYPFVSSPYTAFTVYGLAVLMYTMIVVILPQLTHSSDGKIADGIAIAGASLYVSFPLSCANITVLFLRDGWLFFALGLFSPWISDVFAYFTGVLIGRHKIVPHISPMKTWEGCIGGMIGCAAIVAAVFSLLIYPRFETRLPFPAFLTASILVGILLSVVSQFGDWTASSIKRWAGIKDFGTLLPGHGGVMDRFDSAFFSLPLAFAFGLILI